MRISDASHHLKKTSLWDYGNQADAEDVLTSPDILSKATATIRASLGVNNPETIWRSLGRHLEKQLMQLKAVNITSFGAFGLSQSNDLVFVQDPVFLRMTRLCLASRKRGNLVAPALGPSEHVEDIDVNGLAAEYLHNCSKDLAKTVISSVFAWVTAWAKDGQQMRLSFLPVGEWICDGESVDFRFSESFRTEVALRKADKDKQEAGVAEIAGGDGDSMNNNQFDNQEPLGDQIMCPPHSPRGSTGSEKLDCNTAKGNIAVDTSSAAAKAAAIQSTSPTGRSRYKLRAPTFSSIAKQLPPHGQRRKKRTDSSVEVMSSNSKAKTGTKKKPSAGGRGVTRAAKQVGSVSPKLDPIEFDSETEEIIAAINNIRPGTASTCSVRPCKGALRSKPAPGPSPQQLDTVNRLLNRITNRKSHSMQGLNALEAILRPFKTGAISSTELSLSLRKLGVKVSSSELKNIAKAFSHEKRGYIDITKFMDTLRGPPLSGARLDLVARVFHQMDPTCSGVVNVDEMIKHYDVGVLPQVREGKQSKLEALKAFLQEWGFVCNSTGSTITFDAFVRYYQNVSVCISSDADFELLMHQTWRLPEERQDAENEPPSRTNGKNVSTNLSPRGVSRRASALPDGVQETLNGVETANIEKDTHPSKAWSYLRALLLFPERYQTGISSWPTLDNMCRRLGANRVLGDGNEIMNIKAFAHSLATLDKRLTQKDAYDLSCFVADHCAPSLDDSDTIVLSSLYRLLTTSWNEQATSDAVDYNYVEYYASKAIERLLARVNGFQTGSSHAERQSAVGLNTLEKWLHSSCSNGESLLMKYELRSALMKVGLDIGYQDLDYLFAYFDADHLGFINYLTLLEALRSPSNMLPKMSGHQEKPSTHVEAKPVDDSPFQQPIYAAAPQTTARRRRQAAAREPQLDFRRRNLIHRAIWDQTRKNEMSDTSDRFGKLEIERRRRYRAAQSIQTTFRAFRARQIAAQLRRKAAARTYRFNTLAKEHQQRLAKKMKANRTVLPTAYGF